MTTTCGAGFRVSNKYRFPVRSEFLCEKWYSPNIRCLLQPQCFPSDINFSVSEVRIREPRHVRQIPISESWFSSETSPTSPIQHTVRRGGSRTGRGETDRPRGRYRGVLIRSASGFGLHVTFRYTELRVERDRTASRDARRPTRIT